MTTYRVTVTREGQSWLADVPGLAGTHTWARNLPALDRAVREAIALTEGLPEGAEPGLEVEYTYRTGDADLDAEAAEVRAERARIAAAERALVIRTQALAEQIVTHRGLSVRDAAELLKVSPQRISQVVPRRSTTTTPQPTRRRKMAS